MRKTKISFTNISVAAHGIFGDMQRAEASEQRPVLTLYIEPRQSHPDRDAVRCLEIQGVVMQEMWRSVISFMGYVVAVNDVPGKTDKAFYAPNIAEAGM